MTGTTSTSRRRGLKDVQKRVNFNANELFLIALLTLYFFMPLIILSLIDLQINSHFKFYIISKIQQKVFEQKLNFWAPQRFNDLCAGSAHYNFALLYRRSRSVGWKSLQLSVSQWSRRFRRRDQRTQRLKLSNDWN